MCRCSLKIIANSLSRTLLEELNIDSLVISVCLRLQSEKLTLILFNWYKKWGAWRLPISLANWLWTWISLHYSVERLARSTRLGRSFLWRIHWKYCFAAWVGKGLVQLLRGKLPIQLWLKFERSHKPAWLSFCRHSPDWFGCRQTCFLKVFQDIYGRQLFSLGYWGRG